MDDGLEFLSCLGSATEEMRAGRGVPEGAVQWEGAMYLQGQISAAPSNLGQSGLCNGGTTDNHCFSQGATVAAADKLWLEGKTQIIVSKSKHFHST